MRGQDANLFRIRKASDTAFKISLSCVLLRPSCTNGIFANSISSRYKLQNLILYLLISWIALFMDGK